MKDTRSFFLAYLPGDYEGVRVRLDELAQQGWELIGRAGLLTGRFQATQRTELHYLVRPADPHRTAEQLEEQVRQARESGWEPVDSLWGMDIYKSLPCHAPEVPCVPEDAAAVRALFLRQLRWSLGFLLVTLLSLFALRALSGFGWAQLSQQCYRSDSRLMLTLALPLGGILALLWLGWLFFCVRNRTGSHRPSPRWDMLLRSGLKWFGQALFALTLLVLWLDQIPRLWIRLLLAALSVLALLLLPRVQYLRERNIPSFLPILCVLLPLCLLLGWMVKPVHLNSAASYFRAQSDAPYTVLRAEDVTDPPEGNVTAFYDRTESLALLQEDYYESWEDGTVLQLRTDTCLPGLASLVLADRVPAAAQWEGDLAYLDGENWHQLWFTSGNRVYALSGTLDWREEPLFGNLCNTLK